MKLHVKCDRCGTYAEGRQDFPAYPVVGLPDGWVHLRFFTEPINMNAGYPEGGLKAELCSACANIVEKAAKAAIGRQT